MSRHLLPRRLHLSLVPLAAVPLLLTALSGSLYGALSARGIEAFWLMKLHTGHFGASNRLLDRASCYRHRREELTITDSELEATISTSLSISMAVSSGTTRDGTEGLLATG